MEYNGVLNVYKPKGYTSRDVVNILKKIYGVKKIGHSGTLDPNATGVLPVCIGKATKLVDYIQTMGKTYIGECEFGIETDTLDVWGNTLKSKKVNFSKDDLKNAILKFHNSKILQEPPMYSALKKDGKRLYEYARNGIEVEREKREVEIYSLELLSFNKNRMRIKTTCSKGTYIRVLFKDIAEEVNSYCYMTSLCRSAYGIFEIKNSYSLEILKTMNKEELSNILTPIENVYEYDSINFDKKYFKHISNGLRKSFRIEKEGFFKIFCDNIFIGVGELVSDKEGMKLLKMRNIFLG